MRVTNAVSRKRKKNALFRQLKGCNKQSSYTMGRVLLIKKSTYQFVARKNKKRDMRSLFIQRMNAALRSELNISYSSFVNMLNSSKNSVDIPNRKVLSHLCFNDIQSFKLYAQNVINSFNKQNT
jgi:large subunit ribosomal protein L20